ncbi:MAG: hypothetical protein N2249_04340 [Melioribacter sp.]|nr:hypothetical protein [Melioribacter sp.]
MEFLSEFHNKVVHFPLAIFVLYFLFEFAGVILSKNYLHQSALILLILGVLSSIFSVITGNQAKQLANNLISGKYLLIQLLEKHESYATVTIWYFTTLLFFRIYLITKKKFNYKYQILFVLLSFIGAVLILITGYTGGILVYDYGLGTKLFGK